MSAQFDGGQWKKFTWTQSTTTPYGSHSPNSFDEFIIETRLQKSDLTEANEIIRGIMGKKSTDD